MATTDATTAGSVVLKHANPSFAQTWNRLSINDVTLEVPALPATPASGAPAPELAGIEMGGGEALTGWLDAAAASREQVRVPADGETHDVVIAIDGVHAADVVAEPGARARVVVVAGPQPAGSTAGSALRILAEKGSHVELLEVVAAGDEAAFAESCGIRAAEDATVEVRHYLLGAATSVVGFACDLAGARSSLSLSTRFLTGTGEKTDMNYLARMRGCDTRCRLTFSGVLEEGASKRLADTIDLVHGGKGAKGAEDETVLVNGARIRNLSLPSVLCDEDDVEGTHGATIGSVSGEQLAYLTCRGLTDEEARELFVRSAFDDCLLHVPEAREQVLGAARAALGDEAAAELSDEAADETAWTRGEA